MERDPSINKVDSLKGACYELGRIVDSLPEGPLSPKQQKSWERRRAHHIMKYGEDSILSLFPEKLNKDYRFLVRSTGYLIRSGIRTKGQMIDLSVESLRSVNGIGKKTIELFSSMKKVVVLEKDLHQPLAIFS